MNKKLIFSALIGVSLFSGCIRDIEESFKTIQSVNQVQWDPTIAAPLVNTRLTINDFLNESSSGFIEVDKDNLIHVIYRGDLASLAAKDLVRIPRQEFDGSFTLLPIFITQFETSGSIDLNFTSIFDFDVPGTEMDSILMGSCGVFSELTSEFQHDLEVTIEIPGIKKKDGSSFSLTYDMPYNGSPVVLAKNADITGSFFDLTKSGDKSFGQLLTKFSIKMTKVGNNPITVDDKISFQTNFLYNEYEVIHGLIENADISPGESDTLRLDIFKNIDADLKDLSFRIADPKIKVIIANSYGIPIFADIQEFASFSKKNGKTEATGIPSPLPIPVPTKSQIGETLKDSFELNTTNSNIDDVISQIPDYMIYGYSSEINPGNAVRNFITRNSALSITVDTDIPLYGSTQGFVLNKEVNLDSTFKNLEDVEELDEVSLRLFLENDFPIDVDIQLYFLDENNEAFDSLLNPNQLILKSAVVGADGRIEAPNVYTVDITMNKERFDRIRDAKLGKVVAKLNTYSDGSGNPDVKFFSDYGLSLKLGVQGRGVFNIKTK
mgnify:CR=1 FL=1